MQNHLAAFVQLLSEFQKMAQHLGLLLLLLSSSLSPLAAGAADESFDVRKHLSTVTRYDVIRGAHNEATQSNSVPNECSLVHLNFLARHGTRSPTKKRIKELDRLGIHLKALLSDVDNSSALHRVPNWLLGWRSPWQGKQKGGELIPLGEEELYRLGIRMRERYRDLFDEEYHPDVFSIRATQIPRASASAVAFGMGLLSERGTLGPGKNRAFSVISESRASDTCLRFYDTCRTYKELRRSREPDVEKLKEPIFDEVSSGLISRYQLNFTREVVSSLWFLCKQEASLLDITDQACGLFSPSEIELLEWTDDVEAFILKGYGNPLNYRSAVPLLHDILHAMEQAIMAKEENLAPGTFEKARLRFAHAETVIPFTCLLGLFIEKSEFNKIQSEEPLNLPPKLLQDRKWRGNIIAPFAANNMLALYHCPGNHSISSAFKGKYFVQVLHNEVPAGLPGCDESDFCPFEVFKEKIIDPHLQHDYEMLCNVVSEPPRSMSFISKLMKFFSWPFTQKVGEPHVHKHKAEL